MLRRGLNARSARAAEVSGGRPVLAFLVILSFATQSYITQTHIHHTPSELRGFSHIASGPAEFGPSHDPKKQPADDDPEHCPLCKAVATAGSFVTPGVPILPLPVQAEAAREFSQYVALHTPARTHDWQGRAPPMMEIARLITLPLDR